MTHFICGVIIPKEEIEFAEDYIDKTLEKYSEEYEVESYINETKADLEKEFEKWKKESEDKIKKGTEIKDYELAYFTEDKKAIKEISFKEWVKSWMGYKDEDFDKDGNVLTTRNPNAFYDYYTIGGRWSGLFYEDKEGNDLENNKILIKDLIKKFKEAEGTIKEQILKSLSKEEKHNPYLIYTIVENGEVRQSRQAGWFGTYKEIIKEDEWKKEYLKILEAHKDDFMIKLDCHV